MADIVDRVYLLGAGASVPYGLPTLKTLTWEMCQTLGEGERKVLLEAIFESFNLDLKDPKDSPDFEELLNRLDPSSLLYLEGTGLGGPTATRSQAFTIALAGLRAFIRTKCIQVANERGPFDRLVQCLGNAATIVSFNWDVLLELAFLRAGRGFAYLPSEHAEGKPILLKPHGSINWFALLDRELLMVSEDSNLWGFGDNLSYYMLYLTEPLAEKVDFGSCSPMVKAALSHVPAIVPPNASRLLSVGGVPRDAFVEDGHRRAMKAVWSTFKAALDEARELVVIGYSLPGTDAASTELLKHFALGASGRKKTIHLVEPNPLVARRYSRLLGVEATVVCSKFEDFDPAAL